MLKHLSNISDYKVEYVTENDFYMNKDSLDGYVEYLINEKLLAGSTTGLISYYDNVGRDSSTEKKESENK